MSLVCRSELIVFYKIWVLVFMQDFSSSLCVQTGSGAHPASCTVGTEGHFPGAKARPRRDADHSLPSIAEVEMSRSYTSSPPKRLRACSGTALALLLTEPAVRNERHLFGRPCDAYVIASYRHHVFITAGEAVLRRSAKTINP
jgi:hypothetical protein